MPNENIIYWADSHNCPYGDKTASTIISLVSRGVETLLDLGVKTIVIACNTATTVAIEYLRQHYPDTPFIGLEPAIKPAVQLSTSHKIAILATRATLQSEMYMHTKERYGAQSQVIDIPGDNLVEIVEDDRQDSPEAHQLVERYLRPALDRGVDTVVLACTHYPMLMGAIRSVCGPSVNIIDPAPAVARHTFRILESHGLLATPQNHPTTKYISTSGIEQAEKLKDRTKKYTFTVGV